MKSKDKKQTHEVTDKDFTCIEIPIKKLYKHIDFLNQIEDVDKQTIMLTQKGRWSHLLVSKIRFYELASVYPIIGSSTYYDNRHKILPSNLYAVPLYLFVMTLSDLCNQMIKENENGGN